MSNEKRHPIGQTNGGEFAKRTREDSEVSLAEAHNRRAEDTAMVNQIARQLRTMPPETAEDIAAVFDEINDGAFRDIYSNAHEAIRALQDRQADAAALRGEDSSDLAIVNPLADLADSIYSEAWIKLDGADSQRPQYVSASAAKDAALAIAYADSIDGPNSPFTQDQYDHLTRPWRTIFDDWDTNDTDVPASWDKRRLDSSAIAQMTDVSAARARHLATAAHLKVALAEYGDDSEIERAAIQKLKGRI